MFKSNFSFHYALFLLGNCKNASEVDAVMMLAACSDLISNQDYITLCHLAKDIRTDLLKYETRSEI